MLQTSWMLAKCLFDFPSRSYSLPLSTLCVNSFFLLAFPVFCHLYCPSHSLLSFSFSLLPSTRQFYFFFSRFFVSKSAVTLKILPSILFLNISSMMEFIFYLTFPGFRSSIGYLHSTEGNGVCVMYWQRMYTQTDWIWNFCNVFFCRLFCDPSLCCNALSSAFFSSLQKSFSIIASDKKKEKMKWVPTLSAGP